MARIRSGQGQAPRRRTGEGQANEEAADPGGSHEAAGTGWPGPALSSTRIRHGALLPLALRGRSSSRPANRGEKAERDGGREGLRGFTKEAVARPGAQDGREHAPHASPDVGGLRGLGMGEAERRGRCASPRVPRKGRKVWTVAQLQTFLDRARSDRFFALWVLEATSGMRRCELAGARHDLLDLAAGTLEIDVTRVVVDGHVIESDGKTENARHLLALDPFTLAALKAHVEMLDRERKDHGVSGTRTWRSP